MDTSSNIFTDSSLTIIQFIVRTTVNPEIFGVKIFSDTSKNLKIENTKITCLEIMGVLVFRQTLASENIIYSRICCTKVFGYENFRIYSIG